MVKPCLKYFFLFQTIFFFLTFDPIFAKQLNFKKEKHSSKTNFTYLFLDSQKKEQNIVFSLNTDLIENSRQEIPSLDFLHQKIHTELPRKAHLIAHPKKKKSTTPFRDKKFRFKNPERE